MDTIDLDASSELYWNRVEASTNCFENEGSLAEPVRIFDVPDTAKFPKLRSVPLQERECNSLKELEDYFHSSASHEYGVRLISIFQRSSWSKLQISKPMLKSLVEYHDVDPSFLEVPLGFFARKTNEEQTFCVPWTLLHDEHSFQTFYSFRYAEYRNHPTEPWVIRQIGVYHKFDSRTKRSLYILIHASPGTEAHLRVLKALSDEHSGFQSGSLRLHLIIYSSYLSNWRGYIADHEKRLLPIADTTTATFINRPLRVSHDTLGTVRWLESRFMPLESILKSFDEILDGLTHLTRHVASRSWADSKYQMQFTQRLENSRRMVQGFAQSASFLQKRSNNTATLLADTLAFRNQGIAQEQNGSILVLTRSAVFITVITLVYLPWTLVTGIFGMEFFEMDQKTQKLLTSPQIWIYVVTSMVVTALTMGLYYVMAGVPRNWRRTKSESLGNEAYIPRSLSRGYTDVEKNPGVVSA